MYIMLRSVTTLGLLVALASSQSAMDGSPRYHPHGMEPSRYDISIEIPAAKHRDPEKCEFYENVDYMDQGCEQSCFVDGNFGNVRIQDAHPRKVSTCKSEGTYCRIPIFQHSEVNVTFTNGRCNDECRCMPANDQDDAMYTLRNFAAALLTSKHHHRSQHRVHSGVNQFGVIKMMVPVTEDRNQTACEDYESPFFENRLPELACRQICSFSGNIGGLAFEGKPRVLAQPYHDGFDCDLRLHNHGRISIKGVEQVVPGQCFKGECRPIGYGVPETTPAPQARVIEVTSETFRNENEISSEEDSDAQDSFGN